MTNFTCFECFWVKRGRNCSEVMFYLMQEHRKNWFTILKLTLVNIKSTQENK